MVDSILNKTQHRMANHALKQILTGLATALGSAYDLHLNLETPSFLAPMTRPPITSLWPLHGLGHQDGRQMHDIPKIHPPT